MIRTLARLIRWFHSRFATPNREPEIARAVDRLVEIDCLEPRTLFSAAPVEAPAEVVETNEATELVAEVTVDAAAAMAARDEMSAAEVSGTAENEVSDPVPASDGATEIPGNQAVTLVNVDAQAAEMNASILAIAEDSSEAIGNGGGVDSSFEIGSVSYGDIGGTIEFEQSFTTTEVMVAISGADPFGSLSTFVDLAPDSLIGSSISVGESSTLFSYEGISVIELELNGNASPLDLISELDKLSFVEWAAPNYVYENLEIELTPNDPQFPSQGHHSTMGNINAWDVTTGDPGIVVAVADTGVDWDHQDLAGGIWSNVAEVGGTPGVDDDGNGFIDDFRGWDFASNDNDPDEAGGTDHGTHVAGIVAARINNGIGVAGTAGNVTIMPLRISASPTSAAYAGAFTYAADNGANILNLSFNIDSRVNDPTFTNALQYMYDQGVLHFNSAGNNGALNPPRQVLDQPIFVANTTNADIRSGSSNYGFGIDISAPGSGILSTLPNDTYGTKSGTSMASPNAAGVAALIWSANPTWTRDQVVAQLIATADDIDALNPAYAGLLGSGRVNSDRGVNETIAPPRFEGVNGLPAHLSTAFGANITDWSIDVANVFDIATVNNTANWELRTDGADNTFDTGDDVIITISLDTDYMIGTNRIAFSTAAALGAETYRFRGVSGGLTDPFGNALDGDGDGTGGDHFDRIFTLDPSTTTVEVTGGDVIVRDIIVGGKADDLTISFDGGANEIVITDPGAVFNLTGPGTKVSDTEVRIGVGDLTDDLVIEGLDGIDTITIDSLPSLPGDLIIDGDAINLDTGTITTAGDQVYGGGVILWTDLTVTGANVAFQSTVNSTGGAFAGLVNGDFETGDLSGWNVSGNFVINNGSVDPPGPGTALAPIGGSFDALTAPSGSSLQTLRQSVTVPSGILAASLDWSDRIRNHAGAGFADPNQEFRVLILDAGGGLIQEVFSTNPGDPTQQVGPNNRSVDLTTLFQSLAGQTVQISFEEQDSLFFQNVTVDDIQLTITTPPAMPHSLTVNTTGSGLTNFGGDLGRVSELSSLTTNADGTTLLGGDVNTVGSTVTFNSAVELTADVTITDSGPTGVIFNSTVDSAPGGPFSLGVNTSGTGTVTFNGEVGGSSAFGSLGVTSDAGFSLSSDVTSEGDVSFDADSIAIDSTVHSNGGTVNLVAAGNVTLSATGSIGRRPEVPLTELLTQDFQGFGQRSTTPGATVSLTEGWVNETNGSADDLDWTSDRAGTTSVTTGPSVDHSLGTTLGYYLYVEATGIAAPNKLASVRSQNIDLSTATGAQAEFYYHMLGTGMGSLAVQASGDGGATWTGDLFTVSGNQGSEWQQALVDLSAFDGSSTVMLRFQGTTGTSFSSDIAIDDVRVFYGDLVAPTLPDVYIDAGTTVDIAGTIEAEDVAVFAAGDVTVSASATITQTSPPPGSFDLLVEDFEGFGQRSTAGGASITLQDGWSNQPNGVDDDLDWTSDLGGTPSTGTGPSVDHTLGTTAGTYLYAESSVASPLGKLANLTSPTVDLSGSANSQLQFFYHMLGTGMGSLAVQASSDGGTTWSGDLFSVSGSQGDVWIEALVDLSAFDGESAVTLRFQDTKGTSFSSDIAIDDVRVFGEVPGGGVSITSLTGTVDVAGTIDGTDIAIEADGDVTVTASSSLTQTGGAAGSTTATDFLTQDFQSFGQRSTAVGATVPLIEGWINQPNGTVDDLDWTSDLGGTGSTGTGPSTDHTLGTTAGVYLYIEASGTAAPNKLANLISPTVDLSASTNSQAEFYYHMLGTGMGDLAVQASSDGGTTWSGDLFSIAGSQGDVWNQVTLDLSAFDGESSVMLRFQGTTGTNFSSDIAIDDVRVFGDVTVESDGIAISSLSGSVSIAGSVDAERDISVEAADDIDLASTATVTNTGTGGGGGMSAASTAYGISNSGNFYSIDPTNGNRTLIASTGVTGIVGLAYDSGTDTLFGVNAAADTLVTINRTTGAVSTVGSLGTNVSASGLAFDPNTGTLYQGNTAVLRTINTSTGAATTVGTHLSGIEGLAFDPNNNILYGSYGNDNLYTLNTSTGQATLIGNFGVGNIALSGLTYDPSTDTLYLNDFLGDGFFTVDVNTGAATQVGTTAPGSDIQGLALVPGTGGPAAAPPTVTLTADADGDANGSGGAITMADGSQVDGGDVEVFLNADEDITVSHVLSTGTITATSGNGAILDGGDGDTDFESGALVASGASVGASGNALDTALTNLEAAGGTGGVFVDNTGNLTIGGIGDMVGVSATGGDIDISAASTLSVTETIDAAGGDITLFADNAGSPGTAISILADVLTSGTGDITITGTGGTGTADNGVDIRNAGTEIRTVDGDITISGTSTTNEGVFIFLGAQVNATGSGNIEVTGTGGTGVGEFGIFLTNSPGKISTVDGNIAINGTSDGDEGIVMTGGFEVVSTGSGNIDITGTGNGTPAGGATSAGVVTTGGSKVIGSGGDITVTGTAVDDAGVIVFSEIRNTGDGTITIRGTGGAQQTGDGVVVSGAAALVSVENGDLTIEGTSPNDEGVQIGGAVEATGSGNITIIGTGDTNIPNFDDGVVVFSSGSVTSNTGDITITGHAGDEGVFLQSPVSSTGGGNITITGTSAGASIASNPGFLNTSAGTVTSNGGDITVNANSITIAALIDASAGDIFLRPVDPASTIGIQGAGDFNLAGVEMTRLNSTGTVFVGHPMGTGAVDINAFNYSAETFDLDVTGGSISVTGLNHGNNNVFLRARTGAVTDGDTFGTDVTANNFVATSATGVGTVANPLETDVTRFEGIGGTGGVFLDNTGDLIIGQIGPVIGVFATNADIVINNSGGGITVRETINASGGDISLTGDESGSTNTGILVQADVRTVGNGDITLTGTGGTSSDDGVAIVNPTTDVTTVDGDITINGTSSSDDGVAVVLANVQATGTGSITIQGTGTGTSAGSFGVTASGASTEISASGGEIEITGTGFNGVGVSFAGTAVVTNANGGGISVDGSSTNSDGVTVVGATLSTTGTGGLSISGTGGGGVGDFGVYLSKPPTQDTILSTVDGDLEIDGTSSGDEGVLILSSSQVRSTGSGSITISGTGAGAPPGGQTAHGVVVATAGTTVSAAGGEITINGSANDDFGVLITSGPTITNSGAGGITINGTGGANSFGNSGDGIQVTSSSTAITNLRTVDGDIQLNGASIGGDGVQTSGVIESTGSGSITIIGSSTAIAEGIVVLNTSMPAVTGKVLTNTGSITLDGTGGRSGVVMTFGTPELASSGGGDIDILGTGGTTGGSDGVSMNGALVTTTGAGTIEITGDGSAGDDGIVQLSTTIATTGNGDITLTGTGGGGVSAFGYGGAHPINVVSTDGGNITYNMTGDTDIGGSIDAGGGDIDIDSTGFINMANGAQIITSGFSDVDLTADGDVTLAEVIGGSDVTITSVNGVIMDRGAATDVSGTRVKFNGEVNPGLSPGQLVVNGHVSFAPGSQFTAEVEGTTPGTQHDQLVVNGNVNVNGADLSVILGGGFVPVAGQEIILIDNDSTDLVVGRFNGLPQGTILSLATGGLPALVKLDYFGGTGNDVSLKTLGDATTLLSLDGSGNLVIEDVDGANTDDNLHIRIIGSELWVTDPVNLMGSLIPGATQTTPGTIRIPTAAIAGGLDVNTLGGNDIVTLGAMSGFTGFISLDGGTGQDHIVTNQTDVTLGAGNSFDATGEEVELILSSITTTDGNISVIGSGGSGGNFMGVRLLGTDLVAGATGTVTIAGQGGDTGNNNRGVVISSFSTVSTNNGDIDIDGTGGGTASAGQGVALFSGSNLVAGGNGNLTIDGIGSTSGTTSNDGVFLASGTALIVVDGNLTIVGTGSGSASLNNGVDAVGATLTGNGGGNISITGSGSGSGSNNGGIILSSVLIDTTGGTGSISLNGTGSSNGLSNNSGVSLVNSDLQTGGNGGIDIDGLGGGTTGAANSGVMLLNDSDLAAAGTGTVTINGTGGSGSVQNRGVYLNGTTSSVSSVDGAITIAGTGNGNISMNRGIEIFGATVESTGGGALTLIGTGAIGATGAFNTGVYVLNAEVSTTTGKLSLTGNGGTGSIFNEGVRIQNSDVTTSGDLDIIGVANGGTTGVYNSGVYIFLNTTVNGGAGSSITGTGGGGGGFNHGILMNVGITSNIPLIDIMGAAGSGVTSKDEIGNFF